MSSGRKGPVRFKSKEEIKSFIDEVVKKNHLDDRDHLARLLRISSSALYGYIYRMEIPAKVHQKMATLDPSEISVSSPNNSSAALTQISLDDLLHEIERRGWKVDLSRIAK